MISGRERRRRLLVVMDSGGTAEVAWDEAMVSRLQGLAAVYDVDGGGSAGIMRPLGFDCELPEQQAPGTLRGVPPRFAVALSPASEAWRPGPVLHRVTYTWAGTLPYDTYEWPDNVPCTRADALARCRVRLERGRQQAAIRLADRARRRRAEAWGESMLLRALDPAQGARFQVERCLDLRAESRRRYLVTAARHRNVFALDGAGRPRAAYSLLPAVPGSLAEQLWQQTWLLRHDERRFLRFALAAQQEEGGERVR
jgi:hypothetical protein